MKSCPYCGVRDLTSDMPKATTLTELARELNHQPTRYEAALLEENERLRRTVERLVTVIRNVHGNLLDDRIDAALLDRPADEAPAAHS
jgi:hypothetical protein